MLISGISYNAKSGKYHSPKKQHFPSELFHYNLWGCFLPPFWSHSECKWRSSFKDSSCTRRVVSLAKSSCRASLSWSVLGHVLSEEQSKVGSDGVSDDGCLTIVQCHHYHRPPSSDLYRSSVGILPPLRYHQNKLHSYHCHYQPTPCAFYRSTTTAPPCSTHVPCPRPITSRTHQSRGHESRSPRGPARIYVGILRHHPEYESPYYMFILLPYALHNNPLYVYVLL